MGGTSLALVALLAASCVAASSTASRERELLKIMKPPSFCIPWLDCLPQPVTPVCPDGTVQDANNTSICWKPCPPGYKPAGQWCIPVCPKTPVPPPWVLTSSTATSITCGRCKDKSCEYVPLPGDTVQNCYLRCGQGPYIGLPFPLNTVPPLCCSKACPPSFPIPISATICANKKGKQVSVERKCVQRKGCGGYQQIELPILPRSWTEAICPDKPPTVLPVMTPDGVTCYRCPCGEPAINPDGTLSCSGTASQCPDGYKKCGSYCWDATDPTISVLLAGTDETTCFDFLQHFKDCVKPCPEVLDPPIDPTDGNNTIGVKPN